MSYAQLFGLLLFASQIILNGSSDTSEDSSSDSDEDDTSAETQPATVPKGYVAFPDVHASYKIHMENATWKEARELCMAEGAHLAIADSTEKILHINSLKNNWKYKWLHTGIYFWNAIDAWVRVDNRSPVMIVPWAANNPDGTGNCTGISIVEDGLVDYGCETAVEFFVCEIPINPGQTTGSQKPSENSSDSSSDYSS